MKTIKIPKRSGGFRVIRIPDHASKARMRLLVPELNEVQKGLEKILPGVVHGFAPGRSPVTNARAHVGYRFTVCFDLKDFFDSTSENMVLASLREHVELSDRFDWGKDLGCCLHEECTPQGFPTSPPLANIAAHRMDAELAGLQDYGTTGRRDVETEQKHAEEAEGEGRAEGIGDLRLEISDSRNEESGRRAVVYTRYADDLAFSFDDPAWIPVLRKMVPEVVSRFGYQVNAAKTRVLAAAAGRRVICGVAVDDTGIYATREMRRRLRSARHRGNLAHAKGLAEWCAMKTPNPNGSPRIGPVQRAAAAHLARVMLGQKDVWE